MKAHMGSRCIALLFLQPQLQMGWVVNATARQFETREEDLLLYQL